jgi:hypothetical protein
MFPPNSTARNLYSTNITSKNLRIMGEERNAYKILVGKPDGKRPLGRPRRRWVDNAKTDLREIGWDGMDWSDLAQNRDQWKALVNTIMNLPGSVKYWEIFN